MEKQSRISAGPLRFWFNNSARKNHQGNSASVEQSGPSTKQQLSLFVRNFLKHPRMLGAFLPTSPFVVNSVMEKIDWANARCIVEYGPGVGTFTTEILKRMRPDAALIVLELNQDFVQFLRDTLPDPRLQVTQTSAERVDAVLAEAGQSGADYVLSGIPFSNFSVELRDTIIHKTHKVLRPGGAFLVYQVSAVVHPHLEQVFSHVHREFKPLNIFPIRLFACSP